MSFSRYPEYKDSGVEWLGEVPEHWTSVAIKYMATDEKSIFIDGDWIESKDISGNEIRYITTGNVGEGKYKEQGSGYISSEKFYELNCTEVFPGDILISRLNPPIGRSCLVPDLESRIVTSVDNVIFRPDSCYSRDYLIYLFSCPEYFEHTGNIARGATMQRISRGLLGNIRVVTPPIAEQNSIAAFLYQETAKIDTLIAEQEQLIALLKEKRQAVISHAVTKGLDPNVKMKDSGIEWLGEVPVHWGVLPLKYFASFSGGGTPSRENLSYWNGDIPWVSPKDMKSERIIGAEECITEVGLSNSSSSLLPADRVLMVVRSGILQHTIPVAINDVPVALNQDMKAILFKEGSCLSDFFFRWVQGLNSVLLLAWAKQGATVESIEQAYLANTVFPLPPIEEQKAIIKFINQQVDMFDELTAEAVRGIELLKERRSALISAAVTGKIDVRGSA